MFFADEPMRPKIWISVAFALGIGVIGWVFWRVRLTERPKERAIAAGAKIVPTASTGGMALSPPSRRERALSLISSLSARIAAQRADPAGVRRSAYLIQYQKLLKLLTPEQAEKFLQLVDDVKSIIPQRNEKRASGFFHSQAEENQFVRDSTAADEGAVMDLLGTELYFEYREETDRVPIHLLIGPFCGQEQKYATPFTTAQANSLETSMLETYRLINPNLLWFDPTTYNYSASEYNSYVSQRANAYEVILKDAATYLAPDQLNYLDGFLKMQTRHAISAKPLPFQYR